jgi:hypothetical protein
MTSINRVLTSRRLRIATIAACVSLMAALSPLTARAQFLHPKIKKNETTIHNVIMMPAKVEVMRDTMKGPEGMAAESEDLSGRVEKMVAEVLANKKHVKTMNTPATASGEGDAQQKYSIADFQTKFDDLLPKIMKKRSDVKKGRFTMGDEILNLNVDKSVDAIVFVRGQGQKLSGGKKAFVLLVGGGAAFLNLQIGIIDARTGEVLLYTDPGFKGLGDPTTAINSLRKALEKGFKKLPAAP